MGFNIRNEANLIIHHGNHLLARTFAQNHTAQKKPVRKTAVTAKRRLLLLPERRTAEGMCPENIQISCVNQSRTQGGNL